MDLLQVTEIKFAKLINNEKNLTFIKMRHVNI